MKAKIEKIIKEIIRNEAISTDKLKMLAKKEGLNQKRITYVMRQAGVLKIMGQGVYQVLIRDKNTDDYILKATELMEADIEKRNQNKQKKKKDEPLDMSLPGKWENTKEQPAKEPYHEILDMPDVEAAEKDIDIHAKVLDMVNSFMEQVQTNTNKQNEYISELAARIDEMQRKAPYQRIERFEKLFKEHVDRNSGFMSEHTCDIKELKKRIKELEEKLNNIPSVLDEVEFFNEHLDFHKRIDKRIAAIEDKLKEQNGHPAKNNNLALIKAARGLLADIE